MLIPGLKLRRLIWKLPSMIHQKGVKDLKPAWKPWAVQAIIYPIGANTQWFNGGSTKHKNAQKWPLTLILSVRRMTSSKQTRDKLIGGYFGGTQKRLMDMVPPALRGLKHGQKIVSHEIFSGLWFKSVWQRWNTTVMGRLGINPAGNIWYLLRSLIAIWDV